MEQQINFEMELHALINEIRSNPTSFIPKLAEYSSGFFEKVSTTWGNINVETKEGAAAVEEAIQFLKDVQEQPKLKWSGDIRKVAKEHADDIGPKGLEQVKGSRGQDIKGRLMQHGTVEMACSMSLSYGHQTPIDILMDLLICDGDQSRSNRLNLFNPWNNLIGLYQRKHNSRNYVTAIVYVGWFTKTGEESLLQKKMQEVMNMPIPSPPIDEENKEFIESC